MNRFLILVLSLFLVPVLNHAQTFELVWESDPVFKTPESVYYNAERKQVYVSNINGNPTDKDGNGFISLITPEGKIINLQWIKGMDAPKGMTVIDSLLYVTDIDRIHIININRDRIIKTIDVKGASFLNDMTTDESGNIYITDMQNNEVLKLSGGIVSVWLTDEKIVSPNGLAMQKGSLLVGTENSIQKVNTADKTFKTLIDETGPVDGLVLISGNKFVISDWSGRIMSVSPGEKVVLSNTTQQKIQAADLGYIPETKTLLIPTFFDNRVIARKLP